jgi:hypothetical protein
MKKITSGVIVFCIIGAAVLSFNYVKVSRPLSEVLESDSRNSGINMQAHYLYYVQPKVLVIDVRHISLDKSAADVFRVLLQYASELKEKSFDYVLLQSHGKTKFSLEGDYFKNIGEEYLAQNPVYTMRTFTENVYTPAGEKAFGTWTGGFLGVLNKQLEDFAEFHRKWYVEDM